MIETGTRTETNEATPSERDVDVVVVRDRRAGTVMQLIAVFGAIVSVVGTAIAWQVLTDLEGSVGESLRVGEAATVTLADTVEVAATLVETVDDGLVTIAGSLDAIDSTIDDTADLAAATSSLARTLPESFDDVDAALSVVETLASAIDSTLRAASNIPFGPDYDPDVPFATAVAELRVAFEPIPGDLRAIATELDSFAGSSSELRALVDSLAGDIAVARGAIADSSRLLDEYRARAAEARAVVVSGQDDLRRSVVAARIVLLLVGVLILVSQYVPWWLGRRLPDPARGSGGPLTPRRR